MGLAKVLVVDDDKEIHAILSYVLSEEFEIEYVYNLDEARKFLGKKLVQFIVLDEMLPDGRGTDLCFELKQCSKTGHIPVLMLTSKRELKDKLLAFNSGADDYLVKPFEPLELLARIKTRLKGADAGAALENANTLEVGDLFLDLKTQSVLLTINFTKEEIFFTPIEFKLLYYMAKRKETVISREIMLRDIWGGKSHVVDRTVDQHVSKVRKKLESSEWTLKSSHGRGYSFLKQVVK